MTFYIWKDRISVERLASVSMLLSNVSFDTIVSIASKYVDIKSRILLDDNDVEIDREYLRGFAMRNCKTLCIHIRDHGDDVIMQDDDDDYSMKEDEDADFLLSDDDSDDDCINKEKDWHHLQATTTTTYMDQQYEEI